MGTIMGCLVVECPLTIRAYVGSHFSDGSLDPPRSPTGVVLNLMPRKRWRDSQLLVHNATITTEQNKDFLTNSQSGYVLKILVSPWQPRRSHKKCFYKERVYLVKHVIAKNLL